MAKRFLIIGALVVLVAFLGFWFFIWQPSQKKLVEEKPVFEPKELKVAAGNKSFEKPEQPVSTIGPSWALGTPKEPEFKPFFEEEEEKFSETFLERFSALVIPAEAPVSTPEEESKALLEIPKPAPKKTLTDEEWFKITYPEDYLDYLVDLEGLMKEEGFLADSEKFEFKSEEEITSFLHRAIDFFLQEGILTEETAKNFRNGIDVVLPDFQKEERHQLEAKLNILSFRLNHKIEEFGLFNRIKCLIDSFFKTDAWAFVSFCEEGVLCFRAGAPAPIGTNLWAPCCCCKHKKHMIGCLNSVCPSPASAIWDPMTGICGCG